MIQLYNTLLEPIPNDAKAVCTPSNATNVTYANWGYVQLDAVILTPGQKYNIQLSNPGYVVLNLGYFTAGVSPEYTSGYTNFFYNGFNLNDYNNYLGNTNVIGYTYDVVNYNNIATAYAYVDSNGFTVDLTGLSPNYIMKLGLLQFDYSVNFQSYTVPKSGVTIYANTISSSGFNTFAPNGQSCYCINTNTFLGIPVNTRVKFDTYNFVQNIIGYELGYGFVVNDETVGNLDFQFPTNQSNVVAIPQNLNALVQSNGTVPPSGSSTLIQFGNPQNIPYYSVIGYTNGKTEVIEAIGSNYASGIPNTNAIVASDITLPTPYPAGGVLNLKSVYGGEYNSIWVYSNQYIQCSPNQNELYLFPPYFVPANLSPNVYYVQLNSINPETIYQYIVQPPVVQVSTSSSSSSSTTTSTPVSSSTQNVTNQILKSLSNPIVILVLALVLVGLIVYALV